MSVLSEEDLNEIVDTVWMTVLDLPVEPDSPVDLLKTDCITSSINISGAWHGVVYLKVSVDFLTLAASSVFVKNADDVIDQDRTDTITELTNMLGGTVKCLLPETCNLSLPTLVESDAAADTDREWAHFSCDGYPLAISVVETADGVELAA